MRIVVPEIYDLGQEFFRWEIATAVAGSVIGINTFNQPDVEASKIETRKLTEAYEKSGSLPPESPVLVDGGIKLFTDEKNAAALKQAAASDATLAGYLRAHLNRLHAGDYFAVLGYIQMNDAHESQLQAIRHAVRDKRRVATCLGFGPRFLHSTGQAYKGGPNSGVFLQITCDDAADLAVPGPEIYVRHRESGAGPRRFSGSCGTQPPRAAGSPRRRRGGRPREVAASHPAGAVVTPNFTGPIVSTFFGGIIRGSEVIPQMLRRRRLGAPAGPCTMVIFGAGGDLTKRLLIPAIYNLAAGKLLPEHFAIVGVSIEPFTTEQFREQATKDIHQFATCAVQDESWNWFVKRIYYVCGDFHDANLYAKLKDTLGQTEKEQGTAGQLPFLSRDEPGILSGCRAAARCGRFDGTGRRKMETRGDRKTVWPRPSFRNRLE